MEIIPVAITSAKYPGNRSAAARERAFCRVASFIGGIFVAAFTVELDANT